MRPLVCLLSIGTLLAGCHEYSITGNFSAKATTQDTSLDQDTAVTPPEVETPTSSTTGTPTEPTSSTSTTSPTTVTEPTSPTLTTDTACVPEAEICDGLDNDCDGEVDEDLMTICVNCLGLPGREIACIDGSYDPCPEPEALPTQILRFPATTTECAWGIDGNLDPAAGDYMARVEQFRNLEVPEDTLLCSLEIESLESSLHFDDHLLLTFNEILLLASSRVEVVFDRFDFFYLYDWGDLAGTGGGDVDGGTYCVGGTETCALPDSDSYGILDLSFTERGNQQLLEAAKSISKGAYAFGLIVTGDNDDTDCQHNGVTLEVDITHEEI